MAIIPFLNNAYFAAKVGIGTDSPQTTLHLYDTGGSVLRLGSDAHTDNNKIEFDAVNNGTIYHSIVSNTYSGNLQIRAGDGGSGHEVNIYTDGLFAATFDNNQNVGIGTTGPLGKLHVESGSVGVNLTPVVGADELVLENSGDAGLSIFTPNTNKGSLVFGDPNDAFVGGLVYDHSNNKLTFKVNNSDEVAITSAGNVGIGTTSPNAKLAVRGSGLISQDFFHIEDSGGVRMLEVNSDPAGNAYLQIKNTSGSTNNLINSAGNSYFNGGNVGIGTTSPFTKLHAEGVVTIKGSGTATTGSLAIQDNYGTTNHLGNIGWNRSAGGPYLAYGIKQDGSADWKSTFDNFSGMRSYMKLDNDEMQLAWAPAQQTTVDTVITGLLERFTFQLDSGTLKLNSYDGTNKTGTPTYLLGTDASGNIVKTNTVPGSAAGPYLPLAGGTMTGNIKGGNAVKLLLGAGDVFQLYNDGNGFLRNYTGNLYIDQNTDNGLITFRNDNGTGGIGNYFILDGSTTHAYFSNPGNVGIGTTAPIVKLDVVGTARFADVSPRIVLQETGTAKDFSLKINTDGRLSVLNDNLASEVLTIKQDGNVGIGTTSPTQDLTLYRSSGDTNFLISSNNGASQIFFGDTESDNIGKIDYDHSDNSLNFAVNAAERMRIDSSGNVGIGTTSPSTKLHVYEAGTSMITVDSGATSPYKAGIEFLRSSINGGSIYNDGGAVQIKFESYFAYDSANPSRGGFQFRTAPVSNNTMVDAVRINALGNVGIGTTSPDAKLHID
jgi:hypothetical protein